MIETDYAFYEDQKGPRQGKCTNQVEELVQADLNFIQNIFPKKKDIPSTSLIDLAPSCGISYITIAISENDSSENDGSFHCLQWYFANQTNYHMQNRSPLKEVAITCEQFGVSNEAGAAFATTTLN